MATEFGADFKVLEHSRGQSAVEFLLRRPSSGDFVEALCRFVRDGVDMVTAVEAAESAVRTWEAAGRP